MFCRGNALRKIPAAWYRTWSLKVQWATALLVFLNQLIRNGGFLMKRTNPTTRTEAAHQPSRKREHNWSVGLFSLATATVRSTHSYKLLENFEPLLHYATGKFWTVAVIGAFDANSCPTKRHGWPFSTRACKDCRTFLREIAASGD